MNGRFLTCRARKSFLLVVTYSFIGVRNKSDRPSVKLDVFLLITIFTYTLKDDSMQNKPPLLIFPDKAALSQAMAAQFAMLAYKAVQKRGRFIVCLSGGSTPAMAYRLLAQSGYHYLPWTEMIFFWGDERCVHPNDPESNFSQANQALLRHVPVTTRNVQRIPGELPPFDGAEAYKNALLSYAAPGLAWPRFDLPLLGLGTDGHVASIFANGAASYTARDPVIPIRAEYQDRPAWRVTLTLPVFNSARQILFLVAGADKANALAMTLNGTDLSSNLPARAVQPDSGDVLWLVDEAAATKLSTGA